MKTCARFLTLLFLFILLSSIAGSAQNWKYTKAIRPSDKGANSSFDLLHQDVFGNLYFRIFYTDSVTVGDTSFRHEIYPGIAMNYVVAIFDKRMKFVRAIDLYAPTPYPFWNINVTSDNMGNVFVAGEYTFNVMFCDSLLPSNPCGSDFTPRVFVAKLDNALKIKWIKLVAGTLQTVFAGFFTDSDDNLYVATNHSGNGTTPAVVSFFGQESINHINQFVSVLKTDPNGNRIWRREVNCLKYGPSGKLFFQGNDGIPCLLGESHSTIIVGNDTLLHPNPLGPYMRLPFVVRYDDAGDVKSANLYNISLGLSDLKVGKNSDYYFSGYCWDTCVLGQDTLIQLGDTVISVIGKMNVAGEVEWFDKVKLKPETYRPALQFHLALTDDSLTFATNCGYSFWLNNQYINVGMGPEVLLGQYSPEGELLNTLLTDNNGGITVDHLIQNPCKDLFISGMFKGETHFGEDTLVPRQQFTQDGYLAAVERYASREFSLGADTILRNADVMELEMPQGFQSYLWSNGQTSHSIHISGEELVPGYPNTFWARLSDANCITRDTINIYKASTELVTWPNPTSGVFYLGVFPGYESLEIFNTEGQRVFIASITGASQQNQAIDLAGFDNGVYTLKVNTTAGTLLKKIIKI